MTMAEQTDDESINVFMSLRDAIGTLEEAAIEEKDLMKLQHIPTYETYSRGLYIHNRYDYNRRKYNRPFYQRNNSKYNNQKSDDVRNVPEN